MSSVPESHDAADFWGTPLKVVSSFLPQLFACIYKTLFKKHQYSLESGTNIHHFIQLVIWCRRFEKKLWGDLDLILLKTALKWFARERVNLQSWDSWSNWIFFLTRVEIFREKQTPACVMWRNAAKWSTLQRDVLGSMRNVTRTQLKASTRHLHAWVFNPVHTDAAELMRKIKYPWKPITGCFQTQRESCGLIFFRCLIMTFPN